MALLAFDACSVAVDGRAAAWRRRARALAAGMALGLVGCVPREEGETRLRVSFWSPPGVEEQVARRFEAAHPGVKVDILVTGGRYAEKLQSMIVAGNEPDVIMVHDTFYHDWAARHVLRDVTDLVTEMDRADPFLPMPLDAFQVKGRYFAVPIDSNGMVTYGNLDATAAVGLTFPWDHFSWAELERLGPRLSRHGGNPESPTEYLCAMPQEWYFLLAFGGRCFDDVHHPRHVIVNSPRTIEAIEYWRRMHQRGWAVPRSTVLDQGESEMFRDGRTAFLFWAIASSRIVRGNTALHWDIAPLPAGLEGDPRVPHLSVGLGISRRSPHPDLAREYIRFYASDAGIEVPISEGLFVPVRRRQAYGEAFLGRHPPKSTQFFVAPLEQTTALASVYAPGKLEVDDIIRKRFEQALAEPEVPSTRIVESLEADLRTWLKKMQQKGLL